MKAKRVNPYSRLRPVAGAVRSATGRLASSGVASLEPSRLRSCLAAPRLPVCAALTGMLIASAPAQGQTEAALPEVKVYGTDAAGDYAAGVSTVGGKTPMLIRDIPQSVTVIDRAVMEAQGATTLDDVLRNVPGITIGAAEGGSIGNNINLRGFSARTDLYVDGARDRGQYYRDVFFLDAVEVLKGPSSMLFGRGSTGGVINQVSKVPTLRPHAGVSLALDTNDLLRTTADVNKPLSDTSALRIAVMAQHAGSSRDVMENRDYGIAPSLRFGIGTPTEITLSGLFQHNDDMPDYGLPPVNGHPAPVDRHNFYGLTDDRTIQDVGEARLLVKHKVSRDLTLRNHTQYARYTTDARESGPNSIGTVDALGVYTPLPDGRSTGNATTVPLDQLFVGIGPHARILHDTSLYNQTDLIWKFATGGVKHTLVTGLELGRDTSENQSLSRTDPTASVAPGVTNVFAVVPLTAPAYRSTAPTLITTPGNVADATATTIAPYFNDTIELSPQWKFVGGLRWDRFDASVTNTARAPATAEQTVSFTSVRTGLIYQPDEAQSYYVSYGTSFNPALEALTARNGQEALAPEENRSYEAGAKWDLYDGNLSLNAALFRVVKTNARSEISPGVFDLTGTVRVNGFELGAAGRLTRQWQVLAGYTYLDAEITDASALDATRGNVPANTPQDSAVLWTTYSLTPEWEIGGGATYMSRRFANDDNTVSAGSYLRIDATLAYHQPKYDIRLNLLNLTNRLNYNALIPSDGGRSVPGLDRTALVTFAYKF